MEWLGYPLYTVSEPAEAPNNKVGWSVLMWHVLLGRYVPLPADMDIGLWKAGIVP